MDWQASGLRPRKGLRRLPSAAPNAMGHSQKARTYRACKVDQNDRVFGMRLSKKGEYAVRALIEIGFEAKQRPGSLIQISTVAERTNIPEKFLEQILLALRNGGVLKSKRGVEGGYSLAKDAEDITLGEVIRLLDGPLAPIPCVSATAYEKCSCPDEESCGLHIAMQQVRDAIASILDNYKLSRVIQEVAKHRQTKKTEWQFEI
jgi:Rrf2 family protein